MKKKIIPITLFAVLLLSGVWSLLSILSIQGNARVINYTGVVRGASQRLIKEELYGEPNDALISRLDQIIDELLTGKGNNRLVKMQDPDYQEAMGVLKDSWISMKEEIGNVRQGKSAQTLYQLSEAFFQEADLAVSRAEDYTEKQVNDTVKIFCALFVLVAAGSCLFVVNEYRGRRRLRQIEAAEADNRKEKEKLTAAQNEKK